MKSKPLRIVICAAKPKAKAGPRGKVRTCAAGDMSESQALIDDLKKELPVTESQVESEIDLITKPSVMQKKMHESNLMGKSGREVSKNHSNQKSAAKHAPKVISKG